MTGGTAYGIYPELGVDGINRRCLDMRGVEDQDLTNVKIKTGSALVLVGGGVTWTRFLDLLKDSPHQPLRICFQSVRVNRGSAN